MKSIIERIKKQPEIIAIAFILFVFIQSLFFKYVQLFGEPHPNTYVIFQTLGVWMQSLGLVAIGTVFAAHGAVIIGTCELIASALLLHKKSRMWGYLLGLGLMSGAIFFHIFTPLGVFPYLSWECRDVGCPQEKGLFFMAIAVFILCAYYSFQNRDSLLKAIGLKK